MIQSFSIENYKCFKGKNGVDLGRITILVGPNSSGKSSIFQSLLALRNSSQSLSKESTLVLRKAGIDYGSFEDVIYGHDLKKSISYYITLKISRIFKSEFFLRRKEYGTLIREFGLDKKERFTLVFTFRYNQKNDENRLISFSIFDESNEELISLNSNHPNRNRGILLSKFEKKDKDKLSDIFKFNILSESTTPFDEVLYSGIPISNMNFNNPNYISRKILSKFLRNIFSDLYRTFAKIHYLGPLRKEFDRNFSSTQETPLTVGSRGEATIQMLYKNSQNRRLMNSIGKSLQKLNIIRGLFIRSSKDGFLSVRCSDSKTGEIVNLVDLGFGASQIFPLIVDGFCSQDGTFIISEQPEIHLHPKAQSVLADIMVEMIKDNNKRLIIETHSEHLILRLQTLIAKRRIKSSDVKVYYVNKTRKGSQIKYLKMNEYGDFTVKWPIGFLSEGSKRSLEFLTAKTKAMKKNGSGI